MKRITLFARLAAIVACVFGLIALNVPYTQAASLTVNTTDDEDGTGSACSLREAVNAANIDTDYGGCTASGTYGADTIVIPSGTYTLSNGSAITVSSAITIERTGAQPIVQAANLGNSVNYRIFDVTASGDLTIRNITLQNGGAFSLGFLESGGCIRVTGGRLELTGSTVVQFCRASFEGGAVFGTGAHVIEIDGSVQFSSNQAGDDGGAIRSFGGALGVSGATFEFNSAFGLGSDSGRGGAISYEGESFNVSDSVFTYNGASDGDGGTGAGGAIDVRLVTLGVGVGSIQRSVFENNRAVGTSLGLGGGIYKFGSGTLSISSSVFESNEATGNAASPGYGGGIYVVVGPLVVTSSRLQFNQADTSGEAYYVLNIGAHESITDSCIVGHRGDAAVFNTANLPALIATGNWWGDPSGARTTSNPSSLGDSASGDGTNSVNTANPLTSAPVRAGRLCYSCAVGPSGSGLPRVCGNAPPFVTASPTPTATRTRTPTPDIGGGGG